MTVRELIEKLKLMPLDTEVLVEYYDFEDDNNIQNNIDCIVDYGGVVLIEI